jgi:hypothetical protein
MSTRGIIAFGRVSSWRGVYVHKDAEPSALGRNVFRLWQDGLVTQMLLDEHPGGFLRFPYECYCHGAHSEMWGSCAPDSPNYMKGIPNMLFSVWSADPFMIKWIYLVEDDWIRVLGSYDTGGVKLKRSRKGLLRTQVYAFHEVTSVFLCGPEPNWSEIEREHRVYGVRR